MISSNNVDLSLLFEVMMFMWGNDDLFMVIVLLIGYLMDLFEYDEE